MTLAAELAKAFSLEGRVAVVTGAASGIGQSTARIFAQAGARVVLLDVNEDGLKETAKSIGDKATYRRTDISSAEAVNAVADETVAEFKRLDVWANCAGIGYTHPMMETDPAKAERTIAVNMMGVYWCTIAAARVMRNLGGGSIINVSSSGGSNPSPGYAVYAMTKGAVNSLTWTSSAELGPLGIRVNAVSPGWVETPMGESMFLDEQGKPNAERREAGHNLMKQMSPLGLLGVPSDIGYAVLYLASDASRYVSGQIIAVNGGARVR
jgi:3-oxoacyl-[acyl-carrier protein] reductase